MRLKSGGPVMTVQMIDKMTGVRVSWFNGKKLEHASFQPESLEKAKAEEK